MLVDCTPGSREGENEILCECIHLIQGGSVAGAIREGEGGRLLGGGILVEQFYRLGMSFHKALVEATGNQVLAGVVSDLEDATRHPLWTVINQKIARRGKRRFGNMS